MAASISVRLERALLLFWFSINVVIGALTVRAYGMSIDEPNNYRYAAETLHAYTSFFGVLFEPNYDATYDGHGPAFMIMAGLPVKLIATIFPNVFEPDLWHFSYFIAFLLAGLCLYGLVRRWFSPWTAWGILLLFGTQPLLLGHAFINPKDVPFMFLLTASVLLGFRMVDSIQAGESFISLQNQVTGLARGFQEVDPRHKRRFVALLALALLVATSLLLLSAQINALIEQAVAFFYTASPDSWTGRIFNAVASHTSGISQEKYVTKAQGLFRRAEHYMLLTGLVFFLAYLRLLIQKTTLVALLRDMWRQRNRAKDFVRYAAGSLRQALRSPGIKSWFVEALRASGNRQVILAGVALGLATGVRALAPLAGVIVFLYMLLKARSRAWSTALPYFLIAGIVTYLAWPRLWDAPLMRYFEGLGIISHFSSFPGRVLFDGMFYGPGDLPGSYLPILLSIQFTEPVVLGVYLGLGLFAWRILRSRLRSDLVLYIGLCFVFPLLGLIVLHVPLYHNFRQTLFLVPAMFVLAAFALEFIVNKITHRWVQILLIAALALPGIVSSLRLYPYEYVYYNSFVGGPAGAEDRFELDYWRISLREVAFKLNELAPQGAIIVVTRSAGLFVEYSRPDLIVDKAIDSTLDLSEGYDYLVQVSRWKRWDLFPDVSDTIRIEREGAVLATAKDVQNVGRNQESSE